MQQRSLSNGASSSHFGGALVVDMGWTRRIVAWVRPQALSFGLTSSLCLSCSLALLFLLAGSRSCSLFSFSICPFVSLSLFLFLILSVLLSLCLTFYCSLSLSLPCSSFLMLCGLAPFGLSLSLIACLFVCHLHFTVSSHVCCCVLYISVSGFSGDVYGQNSHCQLLILSLHCQRLASMKRV